MLFVTTEIVKDKIFTANTIFQTRKGNGEKQFDNLLQVGCWSNSDTLSYLNKNLKCMNLAQTQQC